MSTAGVVAVRIVLSIGGWITAFSAFATVLGVYRRESEFEVFTLVIAVSAGFAANALWPSSDARASATEAIKANPKRSMIVGALGIYLIGVTVALAFVLLSISAVQDDLLDQQALTRVQTERADDYAFAANQLARLLCDFATQPGPDCASGFVEAAFP